jgi:hypothetical protein
MERKLTRTYHTLPVKDITLIPVVETSLSYWHDGAGVSVIGTGQPVCVVIVSPSDTKIFAITGEEILPEQFHKEYPDVNIDLGQV